VADSEVRVFSVLSQRIMIERKSVLVPDTANDSGWQDLEPLAGSRCSMGIPLTTSKGIFGLLSIGATTANKFTGTIFASQNPSRYQLLRLFTRTGCMNTPPSARRNSKATLRNLANHKEIWAKRSGPPIIRTIDHLISASAPTRQTPLV